MIVSNTILDAIGKTPLIRLNRASEATGCNIYGKAEFLNPGQSVKDRAALQIVRDAEAKGLLRPGGLIVEGTAGNTGIGLAMVAAALGYRALIVMPRTQSQEKKDAVRSFGAKLLEVDALPYANPGNYVRHSGALAEEKAKTEPNGAIWANQFDNVANRQAHYLTTGPEILEQTNGRIDGFICAIGSGGTLAGVAMALREQKPQVEIGLADPFGAALFSYYTTGALKSEGTSITEGIGQGRITRNLEGLTIDRAYQIPDADALEQVFDLIEHEGLCLGSSSGLNIAGAIRLARDLGPGKTIVTILCDYGSRYQSKLFNRAFLAEHGLPVPAMAMSQDPLVSTEWLAERLGDPGVRSVDASWWFPHENRDAAAEFENAHIPGAVFFDIDAIADPSTSLPHMLPTPDAFAQAVGALGLGDGATIVVYEAGAPRSAARAWWSFRAMGHADVWVLDGGLPKWRREARPFETGAAHLTAATFTPHFDPRLVRSASDIRSVLTDGGAQIADARPAPRFRGEAPEPREGLKSGHMPGARSLPPNEFYAPDGTMLAAADLADKFAAARIDLQQPVISSCGSGITACMIALAMARLGRWDTAVYDGSWAEWGALPDAPVVTGP